MKRFKIFTLGCKVNQYDTQAIREALVGAGLKEAGAESRADIYVINSCTVTAKADGKSLEFICKAKAKDPWATVVLTGCLVHGSLGSLRRQIPGVILVSNRMKNRLAEIVGNHRAAISGKEVSPLKITAFKGHSRAFVKIQDGCNNLCAYCKIPLVRGKSRSRPLGQIKDEVAGLVKKGFQEIVLTGICLGDYGRDFKGSAIGLCDLIEELEKVEGNFRIRLSSIEAKDVKDRLIKIVSKSKNLCPHFHIPFQSGDNAILNRMRRNYRAADYARLVRKLKRIIPDVAVTTDIMVGFPSERESNFRNTLKFIKRVSPSRIHIFPFSSRPGTLAESFSDKVPGGIIKQREREIKELAEKMAGVYYEKYLGRSLTVLVEHCRDKKSGLLTGYTQNYIPVLFPGSDRLMGRLVKVKICRVADGKVSGKVIN